MFAAAFFRASTSGRHVAYSRLFAAAGGSSRAHNHRGAHACLYAFVAVGAGASAPLALRTSTGCEQPKDGPSRTEKWCMIDCGSGWTRIEKFSVHSDDGMVHLDEAARLPAMPVADALAAGEADQQAWLQVLSEHVDCSGGTPIMIGGTGGVRDGVLSGAITAAQLQNFKLLVGAKLGDKAEFHVLTGEHEAAAELSAVRYCVQAFGLGVDGSSNRSSIDPSEVALMSCGGMSSQLVWGDSTATTSSSLETKIKMGNSLALRRGIEEGLQDYDQHLAEVLLKSPDAPVAGSLAGTFVAIEMLGSAGERVGIARQLLSRDEAISALQAFLVDFKEKAAATPPEERVKWDWKNVVQGTQTVLALRLLSLLSPDASLFFCRTFQSERDGAHLLKPSWTLGWYVKSIDK